MTSLLDVERAGAYAAAYAERWGLTPTPPPPGAYDQSPPKPPQEPR